MILIKKQLKKLSKFHNGTKVPDFPVTIVTNITARVFSTDWIHSRHHDQRLHYTWSPPKAFDGIYSGDNRFQSVNQVEQSMKITFDKPQVGLSIIRCCLKLLFKNFTKIKAYVWERDVYGSVCFIVTVSETRYLLFELFLERRNF